MRTPCPCRITEEVLGVPPSTKVATQFHISIWQTAVELRQPYACIVISHHIPRPFSYSTCIYWKFWSLVTLITTDLYWTEKRKSIPKSTDFYIALDFLSFFQLPLCWFNINDSLDPFRHCTFEITFVTISLDSDF